MKVNRGKQLWLVLIPIIIGLIITKVNIRMDITDFFFQGDKPDSAFFMNQLNSDNLQRRTILSVAHKAVDVQIVDDFIKEFESVLTSLSNVQRVWMSGVDEQQSRQLLNLYSKYNIALFSLKPEEQFATLFETENLNKRAQRTRETLLGPESILIKPLIKTDPMLLTVDWFQRIKQTYTDSHFPEDYSILFLESETKGTDLIAQQNLQQQVQLTFQQLNKKFDGRFKLETTGVPIFAINIKSGINKDIQWVSTLSILTIFILFIVVFRSIKTLLLVATMLCLTVGGAVLITQFVFGFVHGLTLALGATLIGICIDFFIHALIHGSKAKNKSSRVQIIKIWPSLLLGGVSTIIGYVALGISGFPGLQQIALFSASGILIALMLTRFLIPSMIDVFRLSLQPQLGSHHILAVMQHRKTRLLLPIIILVCFLFGAFTVQWSTSLVTLTSDLEELKLRDDRIRSNMTDIAPGRFVHAQAENMQSALQLNEQVHIALSELREKGIVDEFFSVFPWIASEKLQNRNLISWNTGLQEDRIARWNNALNDSGLSVEAFPTLKKAKLDYLTLEILLKTKLWPLISAQLLEQDNRATVVTWLGKHDPDRLKNALAPIQGVQYFSQKESLDDIAQGYTMKAKKLLVFGLIAILVLLSCRFRSISQALLVLLPAFLAILFVFGISGVSGKPMNMLHLIGLLLTAAICVDYGIFYFENRSNNLPLTYQAITVSALTSSASFACLGVAENPALQALAWTVSPGIVIGFLLCPVILQQSRTTS